MRSTVSALVIVVLGACSILPFDSPTLVGRWGGHEQDLQATGTHLSLDMHCYLVDFPGPATLHDGRTFTATGTVISASWEAQVGQAWRITGDIHGDTLFMTISYKLLGTTEDRWLPPHPDTLIAGPGYSHGEPCQE